jgi:hypothetical protein
VCDTIIEAGNASDGLCGPCGWILSCIRGIKGRCELRSEYWGGKGMKGFCCLEFGYICGGGISFGVGYNILKS